MKVSKKFDAAKLDLFPTQKADAVEQVMKSFSDNHKNEQQSLDILTDPFAYCVQRPPKRLCQALEAFARGSAGVR